MSSQNLAEVNEKTMGAKFPEVTLPDGNKVQTGTMASLLQNIKAYDELFAKPDQSRHAIYEQQRLEASMRAAIPLLAKTGLFQLFKPEEWCQNGGPGRTFVGSVAKAYQL